MPPGVTAFFMTNIEMIAIDAPTATTAPIREAMTTRAIFQPSREDFPSSLLEESSFSLDGFS